MVASPRLGEDNGRRIAFHAGRIAQTGPPAALGFPLLVISPGHRIPSLITVRSSRTNSFPAYQAQVFAAFENRVSMARGLGYGADLALGLGHCEATWHAAVRTCPAMLAALLNSLCSYTYTWKRGFTMAPSLFAGTTPRRF